LNERAAFFLPFFFVFLGRHDLPANNLADLVSYIQKSQAKVNLANAGVGSASHLCGLMFQASLQQDMTPVPYKGAAPAIADLMGNQVDLLCDQTTNTTSQIAAKKVQAYAVTTAKPLTTPALKDLPTLQSLGLKDFNVTIWHGLYAPKGTPKADIDKLSQAMQTAVADPEVKAKLEAMGVSAVSPDQARPEALRAHLRREIDVLGGLLIKAGVKPE